MATIGIDFTWRRARSGYEVRGERIYPKGRAYEEDRPLEFFPTLYAQFADLSDDPAAFVSFMDKFGPLSHDAEYNGESIPRLRTWRSFMAKLIEVRAENPANLLRIDNLSLSQRRAIQKSWVRAIQKTGATLKEGGGKASSIPSFAANIVTVLCAGPPDGRPTLSLRPDTLWDALLLQFQQSVSSGAALKQCGWCRNLFEVGGATGKRSDARFCSDECRLRSHLSGKAQEPRSKSQKGGRK